MVVLYITRVKFFQTRKGQEFIIADLYLLLNTSLK